MSRIKRSVFKVVLVDDGKQYIVPIEIKYDQKTKASSLTNLKNLKEVATTKNQLIEDAFPLTMMISVIGDKYWKVQAKLPEVTREHPLEKFILTVQSKDFE